MNTTALRKQLATMTQLAEVSENELDVLAAFMGHDIRVHRKFYRLPQAAIQIKMVTRILEDLEEGRIPGKLSYMIKYNIFHRSSKKRKCDNFIL